MHLFELYGIDMSKLTLVNLNELTEDPDLCENYLRVRFLEGYMDLKVRQYVKTDHFINSNPMIID